MKNNFKFRHPDENDAPLIQELARKCPPLDVHTAYTYWVICKFFSESCIIAEDDGVPFAYITAIETDDTVFIWQICISEKYRGMKISALLIDFVVKYAEAKNKLVSVSIDRKNTASNSAFLSYCSKNSYTLKRVGSLSLKDMADVLFVENEEIYTFDFKQRSPCGERPKV